MDLSPNDDAPKLPVPVGSERAPFVFFDAVVTYGSSAGEVQLELGAHTVIATAEGGLRREIVITAHLRCSQAAARDLRDTLDKALELAARAENLASLDAAVPDGAPAGSALQ
jgi:hypothetical protein